MRFKVIDVHQLDCNLQECALSAFNSGGCNYFQSTVMHLRSKDDFSTMLTVRDMFPLHLIHGW